MRGAARWKHGGLNSSRPFWKYVSDERLLYELRLFLSSQTKDSEHFVTSTKSVFPVLDPTFLPEKEGTVILSEVHGKIN